MWEDEPAKKHAWNRLDHGSRTCKDVWGKDNRGKIQLDDFSSGLNALALALESFWGEDVVCEKESWFSWLRLRICSDVFWKRVPVSRVAFLDDIRISVLHLDCIGQWGSRICSNSFQAVLLFCKFSSSFLRDRDWNRWTAMAQGGDSFALAASPP